MLCRSHTRAPEYLSSGPKRTQGSVVVTAIDELMKFNYCVTEMMTHLSYG